MEFIRFIGQDFTHFAGFMIAVWMVGLVTVSVVAAFRGGQ